MILGADWLDPAQRFLEHAWREHERHDLLVERQAERDEEGLKRWETVRVLDPSDGFVEHWLRPVDPLEARPPIRIGGWPEALEADERAAARAVFVQDDPGDVT